MALTAAQKQWADAWVAKGNAPTAAMIAAGYKTPAQTTWTPQNTQNLADAYSSLNPTWKPPADQNAALPNPIKPVTFDPYGDPSYAAGAAAVDNATTHAGAEYGYTDKDGVFHPGYQTHNIAQTTGYDQNGNLITDGADLNPYSQAAILKKNYDNSVRGTDNSYAAQGQLYAGSRINAQDTNQWNYGVSSDQLKRNATNAYHGNFTAYQGVQDSGTAQLAALMGPAFTNFIAGQRGG